MSKKFYIFKIDDKSPSTYHQFHHCQKCLLVAAGIRKFSITESALFIQQITINASKIGFVRMHTHCYYDGICGNLVLDSSHLHGVLTDNSASVYATSLFSKRIGIDQSGGKIVCFTQPDMYAEERCRISLREASDPKNIGEFLFTDGGEYLRFVYILRTLHTKELIVKACENCSSVRWNVFNDELCEAIATL